MQKMRKQKRINLIITIIGLSLICLAVSDQTNNNEFGSWYNYDRSNKEFSLTNPINQIQIEFKINQNQIKVQNMQITVEGYWRSKFKSNQVNINVVSKGEDGLIQIISQKNNQIQFSIKGFQNNQESNFYLSTKTNSINDFSQLKNKCMFNQEFLQCKISNTNKVYILYDTSKSLVNLQSLKTANNIDTLPQLNSFIQSLSINTNQFKQVNQFAKQMITNTLSSLCVQQSQYEGYQFYGLCSNNNLKQIDRHYSLLVIDILFNYHPNLAIWLTQNFIHLLQQKLFYSFSGLQWIPIPQHVKLFLTYLKQVSSTKTLSQSKIRQKINKVIQIQNGLINNLLLSQVNHLSQQINYRQNKKIHPTIMKMLAQAWKTNVPRARVSSIYAQSFTNDFFYHQKNQKLDSSIGKMAWLINLINQHVIVINLYGDSYQKQSLQQLLSLAKVMNKYFVDDPKAQNGEFFSIVQTENTRVYTRSVGYQSLLPFTYQISSIFPTTSMMNLTSSVGLLSMPQTHQKARQTYNFRGNGNLYFNYKILFNMFQKCKDNSKLKVFTPGLKSVIESVQKFIIRSYTENKQSSQSNFYTSWTSKGKGVSSQKYLSLLNIAFLQQKNVISEKTAQQSNEVKNSKQKRQAQK